MTNDSITDDPEHPGIKIIRAHGHVTDDPACILFGTAQTAFAAGLYLDGKLNIPFVPIKLENVVESTPGGEYACSGETFVMVNIVAPDL
ncbi:MAG: hypothetical protein L6Q57_07265 [Alphaproteobacteria bacterium]|nr:hypothetical protein [Alphaproteobacteria bacterium]